MYSKFWNKRNWSCLKNANVLSALTSLLPEWWRVMVWTPNISKSRLSLIYPKAQAHLQVELLPKNDGKRILVKSSVIKKYVRGMYDVFHSMTKFACWTVSGFARRAVIDLEALKVARASLVISIRNSRGKQENDVEHENIWNKDEGKFETAEVFRLHGGRCCWYTWRRRLVISLKLKSGQGRGRQNVIEYKSGEQCVHSLCTQWMKAWSCEPARTLDRNLTVENFRLHPGKASKYTS